MMSIRLVTCIFRGKMYLVAVYVLIVNDIKGRNRSWALVSVVPNSTYSFALQFHIQPAPPHRFVSFHVSPPWMISRIQRQFLLHRFSSMAAQACVNDDSLFELAVDFSIFVTSSNLFAA